MQPHGQLEKIVKEFLIASGWFVFANVEGRNKVGKHSIPGISDLTAIKSGITLWIEIKAGKDTLRDSQIKFRDNVQSHGGRFLEVHDIEDILNYIKNLRERGIKCEKNIQLLL